MKKRILSIVLCLVMVFSLLPFTASAASATPIDEKNFPTRYSGNTCARSSATRS